MQKADALIRTKLRLPFIRQKLVYRLRLQEQLTQGLNCPLTLVTAPAGFGKTTLVAASLAGCGLPVAWLSLDKNDNQPGRFLTYLVAAIQEADPSLGEDAAQILSVAQQAPPQTVLTSLINDLDASQRELVLVLDDYQFIHSQEVHDQLAFLLEHCPQTLHLLIATRSDPPLPLARLRARGQMNELRTDDLGFTEREAAQFLTEVMGLQLDTASVAMLSERTEGWIAGLQMAALSIRDRKDVSGFIESFSGTHRYILDYLLEEVLANQSPEVQLFLLYTSILERLTAPLCDAVTARADSQFMMGHLEKANLFLVPLDDEQTWYRYHHLFADLLSSQLRRSHLEIIPELHLRASIWHEKKGWYEEAIEHAFSSGDIARAAHLIESGAQKLVHQISFETMQNWIDRLPEEMVLQKTWIGITQGWLWVAKAQTGNLDRWMDRVEETFLAAKGEPCSESEQGDIHANIASIRAYDAFFKGDLQGCAELSNQALKLLKPKNMDLRVRILVQLGETYLAMQDPEQASTFLHQAIETGIVVEDFQSLTTASMRLYKALRTLGRLNDAEGMLRKSLQALSKAGRASSPVATKLEQCWGDLLRERGQMTEAGGLLIKALEHARQYNSPLDIVTALIYRSTWLMSLASWDEAKKLLEEAEEVMHTFTLPPTIVNTWSLQMARICLEQGELEHAGQYIRDPAHGEGGIVQSRLLIEKGELEHALGLLSQLEQNALPGQKIGNLIPVYLLQARALHALGDQSAAFEALTRCLALAHPQAYLMTFLDEGEPIYELLRKLQISSLQQPLAGYVHQLLQTFEQRKQQLVFNAKRGELTTAPDQDKVFPIQTLVEPLSQRELEVLHLMALGKTNQEIASQLVVAPGTIKAHAASIYRKLDVANRTEAVTRARQLGILS